LHNFPLLELNQWFKFIFGNGMNVIRVGLLAAGYSIAVQGHITSAD